ncbi:MAG TPA: hypothetical protein PK201_00430 [Accumulibacter sp.]|nr:hypothetical protein [Accumulibacter sp.]
MADRGQITGAILDGPLALDNAISKEVARIKKSESVVAGDPDIRTSGHPCRSRPRRRPHSRQATHLPCRQPARQTRLVRRCLPDGECRTGAEPDENRRLKWETHFWYSTPVRRA